MLGYGWLIAAIILFIVALFLDEELRAEMKDARTAAVCILTMIALYSAIMWLAKQWVIWCL